MSAHISIMMTQWRWRMVTEKGKNVLRCVRLFVYKNIKTCSQSIQKISISIDHSGSSLRIVLSSNSDVSMEQHFRNSKLHMFYGFSAAVKPFVIGFVLPWFMASPAQPSFSVFIPRQISRRILFMIAQTLKSSCLLLSFRKVTLCSLI